MFFFSLSKVGICARVWITSLNLNKDLRGLFIAILSNKAESLTEYSKYYILLKMWQFCLH